MLQNYFRVAARVLLRNKLYVAINLTGLGFALACCIWSYLNYDYRSSFDEIHQNTEAIYRLNSIRKIDGGTQPWAVTPLALAGTVARDHAGVARFARLHSAGATVRQREHVFRETIHYADQTLFDFFHLPLSAGSLAGFTDGRSLVIGEACARKYFGSEAPVGKELILVNAAGTDEVFTVRGVLAKPPLNSSFQFDLLTSLEFTLATGQFGPDEWRNPTLVTTFVEIKEAAGVAAVTQGLGAYAAPHNGVRTDWPVAGFYPQPFREVAASSDVDFANFVHGSPLEPNPRGVVVIVPAVMSLFILLITCFNFTNISMAFAGNRLKEIGIRKVMGGVRPQLVRQFMTENLILSAAAAVLAFGFVQALLPALNGWMGLQLAADLDNPALWLFLGGLPVLTAVVSGLYPAVYLSGFQPIDVLKGKTTIGSGGRFTRLLLTAQFGLSCLALVVGLILTRNAYYQREADFGYDLDGVAVVEVEGERAYTALSHAIGQHPQVRGVGGAAQHIGESSYAATLKGEAQELKAQVAHVGGEAYLKTMGVRLIQGRHFHDGLADLEASVLVNQTLVNALHLKEPLGRQIQLDGKYLTIVGVVNDYKEYGLRGLVPPCVLRPAAPSEFKYLVVNARPEHLAAVSGSLQAAWRKVVPGVPYRGFPQTELVEKERYLNDGLKSVAFFLAVVTLLLSASGLFALVSLDILRRRKEIGLRKVLGASVWQVVALINGSFARIMAVAFVVGSLLGYLLVDKLIFRFIYAYHPPVGVGAFVATLVLLVGACGATIGWKVYHAATANPAGSLRHD